MRVFIAGATGVLERRVMKRLGAKGHEIIALSRSSQNYEWLKNNNIIPYSGNIFDEESLCNGVAGCDAVLHFATAIPTKRRTSLKDWALNDRIRREGTLNFVRAAIQANCELSVR